jgi:hypothetical protein
MAWIKRNLFFLIGSLIAVALIVVGVFYLLGQINDESQVTEDIQKVYADLADLAGRKPHPGNDKIDNIKAAREQEAVLRKYIEKERALFQPIAPIPDLPTNKLSTAEYAREYARELRITIAELRRSADQQSVKLPPDYDFTFKSQKGSLTFDPGSLGELASHLGEIKALSDILFAAKINFLDSIQREIISTNQDTNPSDYLQTRKTVSLPLADLTPYQVSFRCFSAELAQVLASLATSPYGFMVESINVEPASAVNEDTGGPFGPGGGVSPPPFINPTPVPGQPGFDPRTGRRFVIPPPGVGLAPTPAPAPSGRPTEFLKEKAFRVTLLIQVVKPKPEAKVK